MRKATYCVVCGGPWDKCWNLDDEYVQWHKDIFAFVNANDPDLLREAIQSVNERGTPNSNRTRRG